MELGFIRHGQSEWNAKNLFTGWRDVKLSQQGLAKTTAPAKKLKEKGYHFDIAFTSGADPRHQNLQYRAGRRAINCGCRKIKGLRLNERHYGQLQGLDKKQTAEKIRR